MYLFAQTAITKLYTLALTSILLSPLYQRLIWDYKKEYSKNIRRALDSVNWRGSLIVKMLTRK